MMCLCGTHKREQVWVSVVIPGGCWEVPLMPSRLNLPQLGCADRPRASEAATGGLNSVTPLPLSPSASQALSYRMACRCRASHHQLNLGCGNYFGMSTENSLESEAGPSLALGEKIMILGE